jgi:hypothetical protein
MSAARVLLVADWTFDPHAVIDEARRLRRERPEIAFHILVPAWLHGLDWAGDPRASVPCAHRQLEALAELAGAAGIAVRTVAVGDPDPATAIYDAVQDSPFDEVLLFARARRLAFGPLDLQHRVQRLTGLPVRRIAMPLPAATAPPHRRRGHCIQDPAPVA